MTTDDIIDYDKDQPYIIVRRTISVTSRVPFNEEYYPTCRSPRDACDYERDVEFPEKIEAFISNLESEFEAYGGVSDLDYSERITVDWVKQEDTTGNRKDWENDVYKSHDEWEHRSS